MQRFLASGPQLPPIRRADFTRFDPRSLPPSPQPPMECGWVGAPKIKVLTIEVCQKPASRPKKAARQQLGLLVSPNSSRAWGSELSSIGWVQVTRFGRCLSCQNPFEHKGNNAGFFAHSQRKRTSALSPGALSRRFPGVSAVSCGA